MHQLVTAERLHEVLAAVERMNQGGAPISRDMIYHLLQACIKLKDLAACRKLHTIMACSSLDTIAVLADHLIRLFALCGSLMEGILIFCRVTKPSVYTWNAIISAHASLDQGDMVLDSCRKMEQDGISPDKCTFLCLLQLCGSTLDKSWLIHDAIMRSGLESDSRLGNTLVHAYAGCGSLTEARKVFDGLRSRDDVSWGVMISAYAEHGHGLVALELFEKLQQEGLKPSKVSFLGVLKVCGSRECIEQDRLVHAYIIMRGLVHDLIVKSGLDSDLAIGNALVYMYGQCGLLADARKVFVLLSNQDVVSWGALISGYVEHGHGLSALELFRQMQEKGVKPSKVMFLCILKACSSVGAVVQGRLIHEHIMMHALELDMVVGSSLVDMYAKCGSLNEACKVFDKLPRHNAVTWGALISGYVWHGQSLLALELVGKMQLEGIMPSIVTSVCIVKACADTGALGPGRFEHDRIIQSGIASDVILGSAIVDMYAKCGSLEDAEKQFDELPKRNIVSWSAMIAGYVEHGKGFHALDLFEKMKTEGEPPDEVICLCVIKACGSIGAISQGRVIHDHVMTSSMDSDVAVGTALIDMYAKNGQLEDAHRVCDKLRNRNVLSWGALIAGYAQNGCLKLVARCLNSMVEEGLKPNSAIFSSVLVACSHDGLVEEGRQFFKTMIEDHDIAPCMEHYNCMLDLLSRAGHLHEALGFIQGMPTPPNLVMLTSLLTSCAVHNSIELGKFCFEQAVQTNPKYSSGYVLMMNAYVNAQSWEDVQNTKKLKNTALAHKQPGMAWTEVNKVCEFTVGGETRHDFPLELKMQGGLMKLQGHTPQVDRNIGPVESMGTANRKDEPCGRSKESVIAYGIDTYVSSITQEMEHIHTACNDFHNALKTICINK